MATPAKLAPRQSPVRTAFAGLIGNVLEWFDYGVYGFFSAEIGAQFFPGSSPTAQHLKSYAVFALGFFARPIGGLIFGPIGDRIGRRALLTLSIAMMGTATVMIGLLPTYAQIGAAAPILLVLLRVCQGLSVGGEFTGSMVYTTELSSPLVRGLISSSTAAGTTAGFLLGSATATIIQAILGKEATASWGWRLPYLGSVILVLAGWLLRRGISETDEAQKSASVRAPIWPSLVKDWIPIVRTFGIVAMTNAAYYLAFTFALERRKSEPGSDATAFQLATTLSLIVVLICKPVGGWLSDRVGRRRLMIAFTVIGMAIVYFALDLMLKGTPHTFMLGQILLGIPVALALGLQGAMLVEIFPLRTRVTSMSFAYGVTLALSGGIAPFVSTWLIDGVGQATAPAYYIMAYGVIGLLIMWGMPETNSNRLDDLSTTSAAPSAAR